MHKYCITLIVSGGSALLGMTFPQQPEENTAAETQSADDSPALDSPFRRWGIDFSFMFDGYLDRNFNRPASGFNQVRNFDVRANTAHLNMGMISIDRAPAPVGFHLDVGFGQTFDIIHAADKAPEELRYFKQAYISIKPKSWHGVQVDAGQFVTSAGAEVIETNQNWNYSRSLLFALAVPYYHFGIRASIPVVDHLTAGVQVVNGWNNIKDNNSGKTVGLTASYSWAKVTWTNVYYVGPEKDHTNSGLRHLYDTTVLVNVSDRLSYYLNFDYGRDRNVGRGARQWTGIAGAARYMLGRKFAVAGRLEWFGDMDGFSTGTAQSLKEVTLTGEYRMTGWLLSRLEFRNDWSNQSFFETDNGTSKSQPTVLLGLVAYLGPKR